MAVALSLDEAEEAIASRSDRVSVAVHNGPQSTVLSGDESALASVRAELDARDVYCRDLHVKFASHWPAGRALSGRDAPHLREVVAGYTERAHLVDRDGRIRGARWTRLGLLGAERARARAVRARDGASGRRGTRHVHRDRPASGVVRDHRAEPGDVGPQRDRRTVAPSRDARANGAVRIAPRFSTRTESTPPSSRCSIALRRGLDFRTTRGSDEATGSNPRILRLATRTAPDGRPSSGSWESAGRPRSAVSSFVRASTRTIRGSGAIAFRVECCSRPPRT